MDENYEEIIEKDGKEFQEDLDGLAVDIHQILNGPAKAQLKAHFILSMNSILMVIRHALREGPSGIADLNKIMIKHYTRPRIDAKNEAEGKPTLNA